MTKKLQETAPKILEVVKAASNILLHCHPHPDPDSVCSGLAMKEALEQLGKKATLIKGDSAMPSGFSHFPRFDSIVMKSFSEIDLTQFDLFVVQDSGDPSRISMAGGVEFPKSLKMVLIDHHASNKGFGEVSLVDIEYAATCQMLADLFKIWNISITHDMAANLITGMYTDTGGFKYVGTTPETVATFAELAKIAPDYMKAITFMENSNTPENVSFLALAFSSVEVHCGGKLALSVISYQSMQEKGINKDFVNTQSVSNMLKSVIGWEVGVTLVETEPGKVKASFRTRDQDRYDVSVIAQRVGGGGHKGASGANLNMSLAEAKAAVIDAVSKSV